MEVELQPLHPVLQEVQAQWPVSDGLCVYLSSALLCDAETLKWPVEADLWLFAFMRFVSRGYCSLEFNRLESRLPGNLALANDGFGLIEW